MQGKKSEDIGGSGSMTEKREAWKIWVDKNKGGTNPTSKPESVNGIDERIRVLIRVMYLLIVNQPTQ